MARNTHINEYGGEGYNESRPSANSDSSHYEQRASEVLRYGASGEQSLHVSGERSLQSSTSTRARYASNHQVPEAQQNQYVPSAQQNRPAQQARQSRPAQQAQQPRQPRPEQQAQQPRHRTREQYEYYAQTPSQRYAAPRSSRAASYDEPLRSSQRSATASFDAVGRKRSSARNTQAAGAHSAGRTSVRARAAQESTHQARAAQESAHQARASQEAPAYSVRSGSQTRASQQGTSQRSTSSHARYPREQAARVSKHGTSQQQSRRQASQQNQSASDYLRSEYLTAKPQNTGLVSKVLALPWPIPVVIPVLGIILILLFAVFIVTSVAQCSSASSEGSMGASEDEVSVISYTPSTKSIDSIPEASDELTCFTIAEGEGYTPELSESEAQAINEAVSALTSEGYSVGFCVLNLETGSGYAYNLETEIYGASTFKAPVFIYGCQQALETGTLSMSSISSTCEAVIINSDNDSYYTMRDTFEANASESLETWLENLGVSSDLANDTYFPTYASRDSLKLWMNTYLYFEDESSTEEIVSWAKDLFSSTAFSMLRNGVESAEASAASSESADDSADSDDENTASSATVYNKAGWIDGVEDDALNDAGLVVTSDATYLVTLMTSAPDSEANRELVSAVAEALWAAHGELELQAGYVTS